MAKMRVGIIGAGRIAVVMAETLRKMRGLCDCIQKSGKSAGICI